jgi:hypothetical protein
VDLVAARGVFHRITVEGDPASTVLSERAVGATISGYRMSIFAFGNRAVTTHVYPCNRTTRLLFSVVDSNYRAHLMRDPTHEVLQQGETDTGVRGGRGVFGAVVTHAAPLLVPSFSPAVDASGRVAKEPLGEWTPEPASRGAVPTVCIHDVTPLSGLAGVTAPSPLQPGFEVHGALMRDEVTGRDSVELTVPLRRPGAGATLPLLLAGRLLGDTLDVAVVFPVERRGERVRLTRTWPAGPR